jgi:ABC-type sugar transport system substrate-binding protein
VEAAAEQDATELGATRPRFDLQALAARNGTAQIGAAEMLQGAAARQLQTTVTMSDNTNTNSARLTSTAFYMSPSDFSAIVFQQPALSYKVYSPTTLKVGRLLRACASA